MAVTDMMRVEFDGVLKESKRVSLMQADPVPAAPAPATAAAAPAPAAAPAAAGSNASTTPQQTFPGSLMDALRNKSSTMTTHVEEQYKLLEALFNNQKFEVKFDETNKADLEWVEKQIENILNSLPELKLVEAKASGARDSSKEMDKVSEVLNKALDLIKSGLGEPTAAAGTNATAPAAASAKTAAAPATAPAAAAAPATAPKSAAQLNSEMHELKLEFLRNAFAFKREGRMKLEKSAETIKCNTKPLA